MILKKRFLQILLLSNLLLLESIIHFIPATLIPVYQFSKPSIICKSKSNKVKKSNEMKLDNKNKKEEWRMFYSSAMLFSSLKNGIVLNI